MSVMVKIKEYTCKHQILLSIYSVDCLLIIYGLWYISITMLVYLLIFHFFFLQVFCKGEKIQKIMVGCCVDAIVGLFCAIEPGAKCRKRIWPTVIVLSLALDGKWKVFWESVGLTSEISHCIIWFKSAPNLQSFTTMNVATLLESTFIGGQVRLDIVTSRVRNN